MDHQAHNHNHSSSKTTTSNPDDDNKADNNEVAKSLSLQESINLLRLQARLSESVHFWEYQPSSPEQKSLMDFAHQHHSPKSSTDKSSGNDEKKTENDNEEKKEATNNKPRRRGGTIIVEGNIGAGKTTFLQIFEQVCTLTNHTPPLVVPEPINLWRNVGGVNIFQLLADDPKRWSFAFQSYVQLTMHMIHDMKPATPDSLKVMERSIFSAQHVFVENLLAEGLLSPTEHFILEQWFKAAAPVTAVDLIVYLKSDPELVAGRIAARGRPEEAGLSVDVLRALNERHEDWLVRGKHGPLPAPVFIIDANRPIEQVVAHYQAQTKVILGEHLPSLLDAQLKQEA